MTVSTTARTAGPYTGTGLLTVYAFAFKVFLTTDVLVQFVTAAGVLSIGVLGTDYSVSINADQNGSPGGVVILTNVLANGTVLTIGSQVPQTQLVVLTNPGSFYPQIISDALDKLTILIQQALGSIVGAIRVPELGATPVLPVAAVRANQLLSFDSNGNPITVAPASGSAASLATDLASTVLASKNAGQVGFNGALAYAVSTVGYVLANLTGSLGATFMNFLGAGTGAVARTVSDDLLDRVSVMRFMTVAQILDVRAGTLTLDVTTAIQNAVNATPIGATLYFPAGRYKISSAIRLTQPITIAGSGTGSPYNDLGAYIIQSNTAANAFTMVAATANYAFGLYGCIGVHFNDIVIQGLSSASVAVNGVGVDTTINGGIFHIRDCSMTRVIIKYFTNGVNFTGIAYLNRFFDCVVTRCTTAYRIAIGTSGTAGGQTRWIGCNIDLNTTALSLNEDGPGGDFFVTGCTIADGTDGIRTLDDQILTVVGTHFESLTGTGIYVQIPLGKANPSNGSPKTILGNSFNANGVSIWFDKLATAFANGLINFPALIDGNNFQDALALKVTVPAGQTPGWCSTNTVFGQTNSGTSNTQVAASQISAIFFGTDMRKRRYTRRYVFTGAYASGTPLDSLPIGFIPTSVRMYLTANASGFSSFSVGDPQSNNRYISGINAQTQTLNVWINATLAVPEFVVDSTTNNQQILLIGTGGILGAAGVIEIDGFIP